MVRRDINSGRNLATIDSIFLLFPSLNIVDIFLVLIAMKSLSDYYKDQHVF
ncbi:MAG: hypothetical protein FWH37_10080 [Candidatus Bathyarchaeota archaeon]|nr:hypothetical protein [Candidatus Termiticorpusculum sp.]